MRKTIAFIISVLMFVSAGCWSEVPPAETSSSSSAAATSSAEVKTEHETGYRSSLSNPDATEGALKLYNYICDTYGSNIISGQQESTWMGSEQYEFDYILEKTGKLPAIRGLDYMNDDFAGVNRRAAEWYERGGIVTICWHCGTDFSGSWTESQKTEIADWDKALTAGTPENDVLIKGMDKGAEALKELRDKGIPVIWRPFHEFDGAWFWWGKGGAENFRKLWVMMYDRYTDYHGLNNLIWVLGYSHNGKKDMGDWYPGDGYVDVIGADSYDKGANNALFKRVKLLVDEETPICFHECGTIPTIAELHKAPTNWVWFMTWHTNFITDENDPDTLKAIYNDDYVITLDELPNLRI